MKRPNRGFFLLILFFLSMPLFAYRTYDTDSEPVKKLRRLYTLEGYAFPPAAFPLSGERLAALAEELYRGLDDSKVRGILDDFILSLGLPQEGRGLWGIDPEAAFEANIHDDYRWDPARTFHDRFVTYPDLLKTAVYAERKGYPGLHFSFAVKREYHHGEIPLLNFPDVSPEDPFAMENYFVRTGYLAWQNDAFEIRFGRSPVHYGDPRFSSFLPSDRLPFLDSLEYRYRFGPLEMVGYFATLENRITVEEKDFFHRENNPGSLAIHRDEENKLYVGPDGWFYSAPEGQEALENLTRDERLDGGFGRAISLSSMHRFIWGFKKVFVGITAHSLISRDYNSFQLGDIFPVFSWHNGDVGSHNLSLLLDLLWNVYPGIDIYAQAAWDDINAKTVGIPDEGTPTIGAYLLGLGFEGTLFSQPLSAAAEVGTTHYLWGNYYAYSTDVKEGTYFVRAIYRYRAQKGVYLMPLTSPYGPGATWAEMSLSFGGPPGLSGGLAVSYLNRLQLASLITTDYKSNDSIADGGQSHSWAGSLTVRYVFPPLQKWIASVYGRVHYLYYEDFGWPEVELGCKIEGSFLFPWRGN